MSSYIVDRMGSGEPEDDNPTVDRMRHHILSLDSSDTEHPSVRLVHGETQWGLEYYENGLLILQNTTILGSQRHMPNINKDTALDLWKALSEGNLEYVQSKGWKPGYGA